MATVFFSNYFFAGLKFKLPSEQRMLNSRQREPAKQQFLFFPVASSGGIDDFCI